MTVDKQEVAMENAEAGVTHDSEVAKAHFLHNIAQMKNISVLIRKRQDRRFESVYVSDAYANMVKQPVEEALSALDGTGFVKSVHPEDRVYVRRMVKRKMSDDGGADLTLRIAKAEGGYIWCNVNFSFIDDFGEQYIYCTYFDVTVLKENEERLRTAYMSLGDSFYQMTDRTLAMFRVNLTKDRVEDIQGKDLYETDTLERSYSEILELRRENYPIREEQERFLQEFDRQRLMDIYFEGRTRVAQYFFSRRIDERLCFVEFSAVMTRHPMSSDVIAFVTELECNDEKVDETLLDKILARQFDMVAYLANGRYGVVVGDETLIEKGSIFPTSRNGIYRNYLKNQVFPVLHGDKEKREAFKKALDPETIVEQVKKREPYIVNIACDIEGETYHKRFDFYSVDPQARFYILLKSDTTELHREQQARNRQLKEALAEAEQANVAKTAFLSRMSHEIRTPMNAIIGLDNIALQEPDLTDSLKEYLDKIGSSARYLLTLINDILDMSRIESGRMTLKNEDFSFRNFLDQVNTLVDSQCRDRGLHYDCVIHGKVDERYIGDDTKLKQVLINILGNAVKFTEAPGTVSLSVERTAQFKGQSTLRFIIKDTGIGMDAAYIPKIFEAFSQEDDTNTSSYGGSGLGLAITKNIVEMMNGNITVESEKGVGSTFTVDVTMKNTESSGQRDFDVRPQDLNVLIIDDDPVACEHAHIVLEEIGIASDICTSGKEAVEKIRLAHARQEDYNLILVDWKMPEQDGLEVTKAIREILGDSLAIIILTAYNWADIEDEAVSVGVDSFMSKPLFASNVLYEFQQALQKKRLTDDATEEKIDLTGKRILLAEDMLINAEIMKQLLTMKGMEVEHAENGKLTVDAFASHPEDYYDAVLMDVRMPEMDGLEATEHIRALDREDAKKVPIIAMTANAFDEDVQRSLQAGMDAHLSKPVEPEHLYDTLEAFIRKGGAGPHAD